MGALVAAIAVGIILYLTVYKNKLPEFTLPSEEKVRPEQLLDEMLEKAGVYHKYMLDSEELSISLGKDRKIALGTVQNVNDQRISISYHNHQLSEEDDLIVGTYEKKDEGIIFDTIEGGLFEARDQEPEMYFFEYNESADEDRKPLMVQGYDAKLLKEVDYREDPITKEEIEANLGLTFDQFKVMDQTKVELTANLIAIDTGVIQSVMIGYEGQLDGKNVRIVQQMVPGDVEFGDDYKTLKGKHHKIYVDDKGGLLTYNWIEDDILYGMSIPKEYDLFEDQQVVKLIDSITQPLLVQ